MEIRKYLIGISIGYIFGILLVYFIFDYFSWAFALGSLAGVGLLDILEILSNYQNTEFNLKSPIKGTL